MPLNGYDGPITLAAGITHIPTALQAAGYTGRYGFVSANLKNLTGASIYFARRSDVSAANGREIPDADEYHFQATGRGTRDFYKMYVYSAAGGTAHFSGETR